MGRFSTFLVTWTRKFASSVVLGHLIKRDSNLVTTLWVFNILTRKYFEWKIARIAKVLSTLTLWLSTTFTSYHDLSFSIFQQCHRVTQSQHQCHIIIIFNWNILAASKVFDKYNFCWSPCCPFPHDFKDVEFVPIQQSLLQTHQQGLGAGDTRGV